VAAEDAVIGLEMLARGGIDLVILDVWLPRMGGLDALQEIKRRHPEVTVVVISGHGNVEMAVNAIKIGAFDFIEKPLSIERLLTSVRNSLENSGLRQENKRLRQKVKASGAEPEDELIGTSEAIESVRKLALQAAVSDARVLISGENGTGKELLARFIHAKSARATGPFVALNCAAIPEGLVESELFGHEKGAFTDAVARRVGRFEAANGGTLFLDEVADLSPSAQAKLLRVLQDMSFERVGGEARIEVDVRVIAASNKQLQAEVAAGRFREDLYFRLAVVPIRMPGLGERRGDIATLCSSFLDAKDEKERRTLSPEAEAWLAARDWPGNVRELKNAMERIKVLSDERLVGLETVERILGMTPAPTAPTGNGADKYLALPLKEALENFERDYLVQKLKESDYNMVKLAGAVGLGPAPLQARLRKLGIEQEK
jgi:two-component system nitrogen regulation response regulator NtrX